MHYGVRLKLDMNALKRYKLLTLLLLVSLQSCSENSGDSKPEDIAQRNSDSEELAEHRPLIGVFWGTKLSYFSDGTHDESEHWLIERYASGSYRALEVDVSHRFKVYTKVDAEGQGKWGIDTKDGCLFHTLGSSKKYHRKDYVMYDRDTTSWTYDAPLGAIERINYICVEKRISAYIADLPSSYKEVTVEEYDKLHEN